MCRQDAVEDCMPLTMAKKQTGLVQWCCTAEKLMLFRQRWRRTAPRPVPLPPQKGIPTTLYFPPIDEQRRPDCNVQAMHECWKAEPVVLGQSTTLDVDRQEREWKQNGGKGAGDRHKRMALATMQPREMFASGGVRRRHRKKKRWKEKGTGRHPGPVGSRAHNVACVVWRRKTHCCKPSGKQSDEVSRCT